MPAQSNPFDHSGKNIEWKKRVKAVCKPCWELRYCPYGPLVEEFPLKKESDSQSCRIFGHDCPVFYVAEPFTETKELRNISRSIPRPVQFRVLKRENQICSVCSKSVQDGNIHFDHIIPYSKGGSSDEHNIRLLCDDCNLHRGNRFEAENLVACAAEHLQPALDLGFLRILIEAFEFGQDYKRKQKRFPNAEEIAEHFGAVELSVFERRLVETFLDFEQFFAGEKPEEITRTHFIALAKRWGFKDRNIYKLRDMADEYHVVLRELVIMERTLLSRAGWYLSDTKANRKKWEKF
jgi:hypothetical protein